MEEVAIKAMECGGKLHTSKIECVRYSLYHDSLFFGSKLLNVHARTEKKVFVLPNEIDPFLGSDGKLMLSK